MIYAHSSINSEADMILTNGLLLWWMIRLRIF